MLEYHIDRVLDRARNYVAQLFDDFRLTKRDGRTEGRRDEQINGQEEREETREMIRRRREETVS